MNENEYDETLGNVQAEYGLEWDDDSKVRIFARFLKAQKISVKTWKRFVTKQARWEANQ